MGEFQSYVLVHRKAADRLVRYLKLKSYEISQSLRLSC